MAISMDKTKMNHWIMGFSHRGKRRFHWFDLPGPGQIQWALQTRPSAKMTSWLLTGLWHCSCNIHGIHGTWWDYVITSKSWEQNLTYYDKHGEDQDAAAWPLWQHDAARNENLRKLWSKLRWRSRLRLGCVHLRSSLGHRVIFLLKCKDWEPQSRLRDHHVALQLELHSGRIR